MLMLMIASGGFYFGYYVTIFSPINLKLLMLNYNFTEKDANSLIGNMNLAYALSGALAALTCS